MKKTAALILSAVCLLGVMLAVAAVTDAGKAGTEPAVMSDAMLVENLEQAGIREVTAEMLEAARYAYMDIDGAAPEMRDKILEARFQIATRTSWAADGHTASKYDSETGVESELPPFSSLFPDWDMSMIF